VRPELFGQVGQKRVEQCRRELLAEAFLQQESGALGGGERHGDQEFGVIGQVIALIGFRPTEVENILAHGVDFQVSRGEATNFTVNAKYQVAGCPAGFGAGAA